MNDNISEDIHNKLEPLGVKFGSPHAYSRQFSCKFHFNGNHGFYHIAGESCEFLILKGIFKDNVRFLKGETGLQRKVISKIADYLSNIEKNLCFDPEVDFFVDENTVYISDIKRDQSTKGDDLSVFDPKEVPAGLSDVEFSLQHSDIARDKTLYFKGLLSEFLPETLSPLSSSILSDLPDILNPLFIHAGFKTHSPSIKLIAGKVYTNLSNLRLAFNTMSSGEDFLHMNFAPSLYVKNKKRKFRDLDLDLLDIKIDEIDSYIDELKNSVKSVNFDNLHNGIFQEHLGLFAMLAEMIFLRFSRNFIKITKRIKDLQLAAEMVYKTREVNLFEKLAGRKLPKYFDAFSPYVDFPEDMDFEKKSVNEMIKKAGFMNRVFNSNGLAQEIKSVHKFLDKRDELLLVAIDYFRAVDNVLKKTGEELVEKRQIKRPEQISWLEMNEIKNIKQSDYYGNIPFSLYFKRVQHERYKAQFSPNLIYEKDIERIPVIFHDLIEKYSKKTEIVCRVLNPVDNKAFIYDRRNANHDSEVAVFTRISFADIPRLKDVKYIVCDYAPVFSLLFEYACIMNKSLYAGTNGSEVFLMGKKITLNSERLVIQNPE